MLAIDLAVNGKGIAHVTVKNLGSVGPGPSGVDAYEYRVLHDDTWRPTQRTIGRLTHRRDDGAFELVRKVMDEISTGPVDSKLGFLG